MICAIILAAGRSTRMGEQKLLMPFKGMPMAEFVTRTVLSCGFDGTFVVVSRETLDRLTPVEGAGYIVNPDPGRGQDSSFHCALSALPLDASFAVFLADKPAVTAGQIIELRCRFQRSLNAGKSALVPRKGDAPGHPAFYSYIWRDRFLKSGGGGQAKAVLLCHEDGVEWAEFDAGASTDVNENFFLDVDTPEDYRRLTEA